MPAITNLSTVESVFPSIALTLAEDKSLTVPYIAHQIFPALSVVQKQGPIAKDIANHLVYSVKRTEGGVFNRITQKIGSDSYLCEEAGLELPMDDTQVNDLIARLGPQADLFMPVTLYAKKAVDSLLRAREVAVATTMQQNASASDPFYNRRTDATNAWGGASSTPQANVETAREAIRARIGVYPNTMVMSAAVLAKLRKDPDIRSSLRVPAAQGGVTEMLYLDDAVFTQALAPYFGVQRILIGGQVKNTANQQATGNRIDIWPSTSCWLLYVDEDPLFSAGWGRMFNWEAGLSQLAQGITVEQALESNPLMGFIVEAYREPRTAGSVVRVREHLDFKILNADAGQEIYNI